MGVLPVKAKLEVFKKFKEFKALVEKQSGQQTMIFRSDGSGEYQFDAFLRGQGIKREKSCRHTPQQNGVV